ncbi:hypothetical protein D3C73_1457950 [compost metagenome]
MPVNILRHIKIRLQRPAEVFLRQPQLFLAKGAAVSTSVTAFACLIGAAKADGGFYFNQRGASGFRLGLTDGFADGIHIIFLIYP